MCRAAYSYSVDGIQLLDGRREIRRYKFRAHSLATRMQSPTSVELELHGKAVAKLRRKLFSRYAAEVLHVDLASELILLPTVIETRFADSIRRDFRLGGLKYRVSSPTKGIHYELSVKHVRRDCFEGWLVHREGQRMYTRGVFESAFFRIDETVRRYIEAARAEDRQFIT